MNENATGGEASPRESHCVDGANVPASGCSRTDSRYQTLLSISRGELSSGHLAICSHRNLLFSNVDASAHLASLDPTGHEAHQKQANKLNEVCSKNNSNSPDSIGRIAAANDELW